MLQLLHTLDRCVDLVFLQASNPSLETYGFTIDKLPDYKFELAVKDLSSMNNPVRVLATNALGTFRLVNNGGFNQWGYLVDPASISTVTVGRCNTFVKSASVHELSSDIRISLTVNTVFAAASAIGHTSRTEHYDLMFRKQQ